MVEIRFFIMLSWLFTASMARADLMDNFEDEKKVNIPVQEKSFFPKEPKDDHGLEHSDEDTDIRKDLSPPEKTAPVKTEAPKPKMTSSGSKKDAKNDTKRLPVHFKSLGLTGVKGQGVLELHKDVVVTQGDLNLESDQGKVFLDKETNEVKKVFAEGKVKILKKDEASGKLIRANGDTAEFDNEQQLITLRGDAKILKGDDLITGNLIFYNLKTGWIKVEKVKGVVNP